MKVTEIFSTHPSLPPSLSPSLHTCLMEELLDCLLLRVEQQGSHVIVVGCGLGVAIARTKVVLGLVLEA